ncbi:MAG: hypothetical protein HC846_04610 [Blastocatellia bacterium]|nr:hypothetical protein [Blastocatellia bacterium]
MRVAKLRRCSLVPRSRRCRHPIIFFMSLLRKNATQKHKKLIIGTPSAPALSLRKGSHPRTLLRSFARLSWELDAA